MYEPTQNLSTSCLISSPFEERLVGDAAKACREQLGTDPDLVFAFVSSDYRDSIPSFLESIQIDGRAKTVLGGSACGLIGAGHEQENKSGFSLLFLKLPTTQMDITTQSQVSGNPDATILLTKLPLESLESLLEQWNHERSDHPLIGGCITGGPDTEDLFLFDENGVLDEDTLFVHLSGGIRVIPLLAHGCRPIGAPLIVTQVCKNEVLSLARKEPFEVLEEAFRALGEELQMEAGGHIFAGLVIDEETENFRPEDFRIRQIVGAALHDGRLRLEVPVRTGQTLQFLWRDPLAAEMQLREACEETKAKEGSPFAAILFSGKGRGKDLFGVDHRNVSAFEEAFGKLPLAGIHSFGEFGASGPNLVLRNHSVSGALFYPKLDTEEP